jgi:hypothetical protein
MLEGDPSGSTTVVAIDQPNEVNDSTPVKYIDKIDYVNNISVFNAVRFIFEIGE